MVFENSLWLTMSFVHHIIIGYLPVISVMLVGAKYLRVGNCLFLCVQGWGGEHKVKKYIYIFANSWRLSISSN